MYDSRKESFPRGDQLTVFDDSMNVVFCNEGTNCTVPLSDIDSCFIESKSQLHLRHEYFIYCNLKEKVDTKSRKVYIHYGSKLALISLKLSFVRETETILREDLYS